jgi:hypothetical protein
MKLARPWFRETWDSGFAIRRSRQAVPKAWVPLPLGEPSGLVQPIRTAGHWCLLGIADDGEKASLLELQKTDAASRVALFAPWMLRVTHLCNDRHRAGHSRWVAGTLPGAGACTLGFDTKPESPPADGCLLSQRGGGVGIRGQGKHGWPCSRNNRGRSRLAQTAHQIERGGHRSRPVLLVKPVTSPVDE